MISSEVQRTLVKSPPELWTELSDPTALGRHLGDFGDVRIIRVEPEETVAWEAEGASGEVLIKASGWGTRVILRATRESPAAPEPQLASEQPAEEEDPPEAAPAPDEQPAELHAEEALSAEAEVQPQAEPEQWEQPEAEYEPEQPEAIYEPEQLQEDYEPEPRRGFFARLLRRYRGERAVEPELPAPALGEPEPLEPDEEISGRWPAAETELEADPVWPEPLAAPRPSEDPPQGTASADHAPEAQEPAQAQAEAPSEQSEQPAEISAELRAAEEVAAEEVTAVLTSMLDRLGTAHHRPFSRS
jgi:hypothetical protein